MDDCDEVLFDVILEHEVNHAFITGWLFGMLSTTLVLLSIFAIGILFP